MSLNDYRKNPLFRRRVDEYGNPVGEDEEGEERDYLATGSPLTPKDPNKGYSNNELRRAYGMNESPNEEDFSGKKKKTHNDEDSEGIMDYLMDIFS